MLLRVSRFHRSSARQVTLWSYLLLPSFIALDQSSNNCMVRICLTSGFWEVDDDVEPIILLFSNLWELLLRYARDCYAMLVDVDWVSVSMTDVSIVN